MDNFAFRDPITSSVVLHRLQAINQEMGLVMERTSRSPIFAQVHDFSCAICDARYRIISQVDGVPSHTASSMLAARAVADFFGADMAPGDVFLINDPYAGGTHLADVTVIKPIFMDGRLLFVAVNRAHHSDIGGLCAGSYSPLASEIYHEGIRIPPVRIYRGNEALEDVLNLVTMNTRTPDVLLSDLKAQVASCMVGEKRVLEVASRYPAIAAICDEIQDYAEFRMRQELSRFKEGTYTGTSYLDGDGFDRRQIKIHATLTIKDGEATVDFAGTDPQTTGFVNSPFGNSATSVYVPFLTVVKSDVPRCEGAYRPIKVLAEEGTVVNPRPPVPVAGCTLDTACAIAEAVYQALSQVVPDRAPAGWDRFCGPALSGKDPKTGETFVQYAFCAKGGAGAMPGMDGTPALGNGIDLGGLTAPNIESNEMQYPHVTDVYELTPDSGGAGRFRGGLGVYYRIRLLADTEAVFFGDGQVNPPYGLFGGHPGSPNRLILSEGTPEEREITSKSVHRFKAGAVLSVKASGGGGWGDPLTRDPAKVAEDCLNGWVSRESARRDYGVVVDGQARVLEAETQKLRDERRRASR